MYVKEHETFESKLAEVTKWLEEPEKKLKECSILIGDIPTLQERKSFLEVRMFNKISKTNKFYLLRLSFILWLLKLFLLNML